MKIEQRIVLGEYVMRRRRQYVEAECQSSYLQLVLRLGYEGRLFKVFPLQRPLTSKNLATRLL